VCELCVLGCVCGVFVVCVSLLWVCVRVRFVRLFVCGLYVCCFCLFFVCCVCVVCFVFVWVCCVCVVCFLCMVCL